MPILLPAQPALVVLLAHMRGFLCQKNHQAGCSARKRRGARQQRNAKWKRGNNTGGETREWRKEGDIKTSGDGERQVNKSFWLCLGRQRPLLDRQPQATATRFIKNKLV